MGAISKIKYSCLLYLNAKKDKNHIQWLQNKALRICMMAGIYDSNLHLHRMAKVIPIETVGNWKSTSPDHCPFFKVSFENIPHYILRPV